MDASDLKSLADRSRLMREAGIGLVIGSFVLAIFLFIPLRPEAQVASPAAALASTTAPDAFANVQFQGKAAIVYDLSDNQVLFEKNADAQLPLASLTKLLTIYTGLVTLGPDAVITIPEDATQVDAPHAFSQGDQFTLSNLARITLTGSLNDGATAIADAIAAQKSTDIPTALDTEASALGLSATYSVNGSGLDVNTTLSGGYGSAHDIAILAGDVAKLAPDVALATTQDSATASDLAGQSYTAKNTNPGVSRAPRLLLSKTGFTDLAGGNLALVFDAGIDHPIAIVVLGSTEDARFTDGDALVAATLAYFAGQPSL